MTDVQMVEMKQVKVRGRGRRVRKAIRQAQAAGWQIDGTQFVSSFQAGPLRSSFTVINMKRPLRNLPLHSKPRSPLE